MLKRLAALLVLLLQLPLCVQAETAEGPASLREATSIEEVKQFIIYPPEDGVAGVKAGYIRHIAQHRANDPDNFRTHYWLGGPEGTELDLTDKRKPNGERYEYYVANMCTRAAYSMALSYLGIDMTPGDMSATTGERDLDMPYTEISDLFSLERVTPSSNVFDTMMENYLSDPSYSPVLVHIRRPDDSLHSFLVVAAMPQKSRYVIVDPSAILSRGKGYSVYMVAFNKSRTEIDTSTFRYELRGSRIIGLYQWKLPDDKGAETAE